MQCTDSHAYGDHTLSSDLTPLSNPGDIAASLEKQLLSRNWVETCEGLLQFRRILRFHTSVFEVKLDELVRSVIACLTNLRSAVVKAALLCIEDLALVLKGDITRFVDGSSSCILLSVIEKSSFDKKFVMAQAHSVLKSLIAVLPTVNVVEVVLLSTSHIRPTFRAQIAFAIDLALQKVDNIQVRFTVFISTLLIHQQEELSQFYIKLLIESFKLVCQHSNTKCPDPRSINQANDSHEQTRRYGSQAVSKIESSFLRTNSVEAWYAVLLKNLNTNLYLTVLRRQARAMS